MEVAQRPVGTGLVVDDPQVERPLPLDQKVGVPDQRITELVLAKELVAQDRAVLLDGRAKLLGKDGEAARLPDY